MSDWMEFADCRDGHADDWIAETSELTALNLDAVRVCVTCPVRQDCADTYAYMHPKWRANVIAAGVVYDERGHVRPLLSDLADRTRCAAVDCAAPLDGARLARGARYCSRQCRRRCEERRARNRARTGVAA